MGFFSNVKLKKFITDYLYFSKKERIAVFVIITLLLLSFLPSILIKSRQDIQVDENPEFAKLVDSLRVSDSGRNDHYEQPNMAFQYKPEPEYENGELFQFDPNTLTAEGWQRLGLNNRTINTLINYRNKGGKFYKTEDLKKIWGMPVGFYERVKGLIKITTFQKTYSSSEYRSTYKPVERKPLIVDINEADTTAFIALPGIGSKLAARIVNFRDKLGGFHSINQVGETYGVPDSTFQYIRSMLVLSNTKVRKININTVTKDELKLHPYIRWNLANAIVEYRSQHGDYSDLNELKQIAIIDEAIFNKIVPYLTTSSLENE